MAQTFATVRPVVRHEHMILGGDGARLSLECGRTRILVFEQMERLGERTNPDVFVRCLEHALRLGPEMPPQLRVVYAERDALEAQKAVCRIELGPIR